MAWAARVNEFVERLSDADLKVLIEALQASLGAPAGEGCNPPTHTLLINQADADAIEFEILREARVIHSAAGRPRLTFRYAKSGQG